MAARMPAPPAPTMTVSYLWIFMILAAPCLADVRVEGEDHQRAQQDGEHRGGVQQALQPQSAGRALRVVVDDRAQAVGAVQHREPEHQEVPDLPERGRPATGHEGEADLGDAAVKDELDEQVAD